MSLNWFNTSTENGIDTASFSGNFKILGDIEVTGLVRRNGEVFESITPQWNVNSPGKIYFNPVGISPNVGIGTSVPTRALEVVGDISYTGNLVRNNQILNFGLGAWDGNTSGTIYYGGNVNNRVGVGSGFGPDITARGVIHAWGISQFNTQSSSPWDPINGIRIGPHEINDPFLQMGVMKSPTKSWSWIQSATVTTITNSSLFSTSDKPLMLNPVGGNIGVGVFSIDNVDASISITSRGGANEFTGSKFRKTISMGPETHNSETIDYNHLIYSKYFAMGFRDNNAGIGAGDRGLYIMTSTNTTSWRTENWKGSVIATYKVDGNMGVGTTEPRLRLSISSTSSNGISISNPNIDDDLGFGIQRSLNGLSFGTLPGSDTVVSEIMLVRNNGVKGIKVSDTVESSFYRIGNDVVMSAGQLGSSIQASSLTSVGTLTGLTVSGDASIGVNLTTGGSIIAGGVVQCNRRLVCNSNDSFVPGVDLRNTSVTTGRVWQITNESGLMNIRSYNGTGETAQLPLIILNGRNVFVNGGLFSTQGYSPPRQDITAIITNGFGGAQLDWPIGWGARALSTSDISCLGLYYSTLQQRSDRRHKDDIENLNIGLVELCKLRPVSYRLKTNLDTKRYGFIAQEVEEIIPDFVQEDTNDMKSLKDGILPLAVKSIIELNKKLENEINIRTQLNEKLENEINSLRSEITDLKNMLMAFINK